MDKRKFSASNRKRNSSRKLYSNASLSFPLTSIVFFIFGFALMSSAIVWVRACADSEKACSNVMPDAWNFMSAVWGRNLYVIVLLRRRGFYKFLVWNRNPFKEADLSAFMNDEGTNEQKLKILEGLPQIPITEKIRILRRGNPEYRLKELLSRDCECYLVGDVANPQNYISRGRIPNLNPEREYDWVFFEGREELKGREILRCDNKKVEELPKLLLDAGVKPSFPLFLSAFVKVSK